MATGKKGTKTKLTTDMSVFANQSQSLQDSPKENKPPKRLRNDDFDEEDMSRLIAEYQDSRKKKKEDITIESSVKSRQKIVELANNHRQARKECNESICKSISEITNLAETDYAALRENEQKLEHMTASYMKCIQQSAGAYKQKIKALKEFSTTYMKRYVEMESKHKEETETVIKELDNDVKKLHDKLVMDSKRNSWATVQRSIFNAMKNDF